MLERPAALDEKYRSLYGRVFTYWADSPWRLIRFLKSWEYSCFEEYIAPQNCVGWSRGNVTIDKGGYGRCSGELQLIHGSTDPAYLLAADTIGRGGRFVLTPA